MGMFFSSSFVRLPFVGWLIRVVVPSRGLYQCASDRVGPVFQVREGAQCHLLTEMRPDQSNVKFHSFGFPFSRCVVKLRRSLATVTHTSYRPKKPRKA